MGQELSGVSGVAGGSLGAELGEAGGAEAGKISRRFCPKISIKAGN